MRAEPSGATSPAGAGIASGIAWTYLHVIAYIVFNLFLAGFVLRRLGSADYGYVALITTIANLLTVVDLGLGTTVVRAMAQLDAVTDEPGQGQLRQDIEVTHGLYLCLGILALAVTFVAALFVAAGDGMTIVTVTSLLIAASVAASVATSALPGLATGRRQFRLVSLSTVIGIIVNAVLVVGLVDVLGVAAVGIGALAAVVVNRSALVVWARNALPWFPLFPRPPQLGHLRRVAAMALPLVVVGISGQLVAAVDLLVVGSVASVAAVGLYKLGSLLPAQAVGVLYRGYDVIFPSLAGTNDPAMQQNASVLLTRVAAYVAGCGFLAMAILSDEVVAMVAGSPSGLAASVLAVFSIVWLCNVPVHGLALLLIARGQQRVLTVLVAVEAAANLILTVPLAASLGPIGAAYATLVTLGLSNGIVLPLLVRRRLRSEAWRIALHGMRSAACGAVIGGVTAVIASILASGRTAVLLAVALVAILGVPIGLLLLGTEGRRALRASCTATTVIRAPQVPVAAADTLSDGFR